MPNAIQAPQIEIAQFMEVACGSGKNSLFISEKGGNLAQSIDCLAKNGLRPLTYQEALSRSSELINKLKGK